MMIPGHVVRNTRGVTGFVGPGSKPVPLEEEEMANLGIKQEDIVVDFEVGDTVTVLSGAWGRYCWYDPGDQRTETEPVDQCRAVRPRDSG